MTTQKKPEERKKEIVETAAKMFSQKGYKATQISEIVDEIGVAKGLFYYYFKSKEEVMEAVAENYAEKVFEKIKKMINSEKKCEEKIYAIFTIFINMAKEKQPLFSIIQQADNGIIHQKVWNSLGNKLIPLVNTIISDAMLKNEISCSFPDETTDVLVRGILGSLSKIPPTERVTYLENNLNVIMDIIKNAYGIESEK